MKVAICTPVYRDTHWRYTESLANLLLRSPSVQFVCNIIPGHFIGDQRNLLAERSMEQGAEWLFWLDSDQVFPHDTLMRLLSRKVDIVGPNIARRSTPTGPTAGRLTNDGSRMLPVWTRPEQAQASELEEVDGLGFGICLVSRRVFEAVPRPWFDNRNEDYLFCAKAKLAGFKVYCDHGLTADVGHVGEKVLTMLDTIADRPLIQHMMSKR